MLFPEIDPVRRAIDRLQEYEPPEGYYLAFSGGKDSQCIYHLAKEAGVKFDAHYNVTTVDPPPLLQFIKKNYPDVAFDLPKMTMWELIPHKRMPPTRIVRYCCKALKERGGDGRVVITGVRAAESNGRMKFAAIWKTGWPLKGSRSLNPIIDWSEADVWGYIDSRKLEYCNLYDKGFCRIGCVGCPMAGPKMQMFEFRMFPTIYKKYLKAFQEMVDKRIADGMETQWKTGEDVMDWWLKQ